MSILTFFQDMSTINNILLLGSIFLFAFIFWMEHKKSDSPILFSDLLVDPKINKVSNTKLGHFIGIFLSSWIVMNMAIKDVLDPNFYTIFGIWLAFLTASQGIRSYFGSKDKSEIITKEDK